MSETIKISDELIATAKKASNAYNHLEYVSAPKGVVTVCFASNEDFRQWIEHLRFVVQRATAILKEAPQQLGASAEQFAAYPKPDELLKLQTKVLGRLNLKVEVPTDMLFTGPLREVCQTIGGSKFLKELFVPYGLREIVAEHLNLFEKNASAWEFAKPGCEFIPESFDSNVFDVALESFANFLRQLQWQTPVTKSEQNCPEGAEKPSKIVRIVQSGTKIEVSIEKTSTKLIPSRKRLLLCAYLALNESQSEFYNVTFSQHYKGEYIPDKSRKDVRRAVKVMTQDLLIGLECNRTKKNKIRTWRGVRFELVNCDKPAVEKKAEELRLTCTAD